MALEVTQADPTEGNAMKCIRTDDLALTTTLRIHGFEYEWLELDGTKVLWLFEDGDEIQRLVLKYKAGESRIEPRKYNKVLRDTRRDLFAFLNENGLPPRPNPNA